jgi:hypothetical protein
MSSSNIVTKYYSHEIDGFGFHLAKIPAERRFTASENFHRVFIGTEILENYALASKLAVPIKNLRKFTKVLHLLSTTLI